MKPLLDNWRKFVIKERLESEVSQKIADHYLELILKTGKYDDVPDDKKPKIKDTPSSSSAVITNTGGRKTREDILNKIKLNMLGLDNHEIEVVNEPQQGIFRINYIHSDSGQRKFFVELRAGATPLAKENLSIEQVKELFNLAAKGYTPVDEELFQNVPQTFRIISGDLKNPQILQEFVNILPQINDIKGTPKADFYIGGSTGNKIYISQKDGINVKDFGQWAGLSGRAGEAISKSEEVERFGSIIKKVILTDLKFPEYPSSIDFQMPIEDRNLRMAAIFGPEYSPEGDGSADNVDLVVQGDYDIAVYSDLESKKMYIDLGPQHYILRKGLINNVPDAQYNPILNIEEEPVLSTRRGDSGRRSFGIPRARATIYPRGGRQVNFVINSDSTPENFNFDKTTQTDTRQMKNVTNFFKEALENIGSPQGENESLGDAVSRSQNNTLIKLYDSIGSPAEQ
jgi:hypothetical protein